MNRTAWISVVIVALLAAGAAWWMWQSRQPAPAPVAEAPAAPPPAPPPAEPAVRYPLADAANEPIPAEGNNDAAFRELLSGLLGGNMFSRFLENEAIARRFVATVDNLPREELPLQIRSVKPVDGHFEVARQDGATVLSERNYARYAPLVKLVDTVDTQKIVEAYTRAYPALQAQYRALGYPDKYFNDRLVQAIDDMLAAPTPAEPIRLVQPKIRYQFADPDLEALSAGRKIMVRMGPQNAARVKAKLRALRAELTRGAPATAASPQR